MLIDVLRQPLPPSDEYQYLMYVCERPSEGVIISHVKTTVIPYDYAIVYSEGGDLECMLLPSLSLVDRATKLLEDEDIEVTKIIVV